MVELLNNYNVVVESPLISPKVTPPPTTDLQIVVATTAIPPVGPSPTGYVHPQPTPSATWTIVHNLGVSKVPTVVLDSSPTSPVFTNVEFPDLNTTVLEFPSAESGWAYI